MTIRRITLTHGTEFEAERTQIPDGADEEIELVARAFHDHQALVEHLQMFEGRTVVSAEIVNCRVDDQVLAAICRSLGAPSLRLLDLSGNRITHRGVGALTALPSEHLDQWFLASNEIGDEGLRAWMRGVRVPVHVLDLGACGLTEESLRATRNSPMTREIRSLDVSWVLADADALCDFFRRGAMPCLTAVAANHTEADDRVIAELSGRGGEAIRSLSLAGTAVTDRGCRLLAESDGFALEELNIALSRTTEAGARALLDRWPHLKLTYHWPVARGR